MRQTATSGSENLEARDALVMSHVGLVKAMANRLARRLPPHVEVSELMGVGVLGLIDAAGRYRPSLGVPFDAFARCRIQGAMLDALRGLDWAPRAVRKMRRDADATIARLRHTLGRDPETAEVARAMSVSEEQYDRMLDQLRSADLATIRRGRPDDGGANLIEVAIGPDEDGPHARLERRELAQLLARALGEVPERERHILSLYYDHELTLVEIGKVIGVGESRVSQLRTQAIARLRSRMTEFLAPSDDPHVTGHRRARRTRPDWRLHVRGRPASARLSAADSVMNDIIDKVTSAIAQTTEHADRPRRRSHAMRLPTLVGLCDAIVSEHQDEAGRHRLHVVPQHGRARSLPDYSAD